MVFKDFDGNYRIAYHENNCHSGKERAAIYYVKVERGEVKVYENQKTNQYFAYDSLIDSTYGGLHCLQQ